MKDIVVYGSGGFAREVILLLEIINQKEKYWNILGFIDDNDKNHGKNINGYKVLGGQEWLNDKKVSVALGIGDPHIKKMIISKLGKYSNLKFPNIIHPSVYIHETNTLGMGNIICEGNILTCNIQIKDFVTINLNSTIGHDAVINSYSTILPNSSISGNVVLEECVNFGTNATVIQGITIGRETIIGAGAIVVKDLPPYCTAVGSPAKPIKFHK